jgi:D-alanine-D-alanine ligase
MRVLLLAHTDLIPPPDIKAKDIDWDNDSWVTEYDVISTLRKLKHEVEVLGVIEDLRKIREAVDRFKPHVVFNLLEEFAGEAIFDQNVVSYLELLQLSYTGCNPRGLVLARDKALTKKILTYHRIPTPKFAVFPRNQKRRRPKHLGFPLIVKCLNEEASRGISNASLVNSDSKLSERVEYINKTIGCDAIAEQFVEGREYFVGIYGNFRLTMLPIWELNFDRSDNPEKMFYSESAKFNAAYRKRHGITTRPAKLDEATIKRVYEICKRTYRALNFNGYGRIDLRITSGGKIFVLEANPNPDLDHNDEFALSATHAGIKYPELIKRIIKLAQQWRPTKSLPQQIVE